MIKVRSKNTPTSKPEMPTLKKKSFVNTLKKQIMRRQLTQ